MIEEIIRKEIEAMLSEDKKDSDSQKKPEKKKKVKAKPGRGRVKTYIQAAKARAQSDPEGLIKDLKINDSVFENTTLTFEEQITAMLRSAFSGTAPMTSAFKGIRYSQGENASVVTMSMLDTRDGVMFVNHILQAAQKANIVELKKDIEVIASGDGVLVKFIQT